MKRARNALDHLTRATNALNQETQYQYDALNRLARITWADGQIARFSYDGSLNATGRLSRIEETEGTTDYAYDGFARIASKTQTLRNGATHTVRYTYAPGGQLASVTTPGGKVISYSRQAVRITAITHNLLMPTGTSTFALGQTRHTIDYDNRGRITAITRDLPLPPPPPTEMPGRYIPGFAPKAAATTSTTDTLGPEASTANSPTARFGERETFSYDANGNRTSKTEIVRLINPTTGKLGAAITTERSYTVADNSNRLTGFAQTIAQSNAKGVVQSSASLSVNLALDAAGNHISDGLKTYEHDASGRLSRLRYLKSGEPMSVIYLHNALGQRTFKSEPVTDQTTPDPDTLGQSFYEWLQTRFAWLFVTTKKNDRTKLGTAFVYSETGEMIGEYGTGGTQSTGATEYIYLPTEQGNLLVGAIINGQTYAVHTDHLNTPRLMTDAANEPVWQWGYSAFGDNEPSIAARNFKDRSWAFARGELKDLADGSDDVDNNAQFTKKMVKLNVRGVGQYFDDESNLLHNGYRTLNPGTGRYTQVDPIGLNGGWNPYLHVEGNPLMFTDSEGLQSDVRMNRPGWPVFMQPTQPNRNCATAECVAGMLPAPSENRTNDEVSRDLNRRICKWSCEKAASAVTGGGAGICRLPLPAKYGATSASKQVCRMVCE